jgi:RNA methyltransferase, TrmH family
VELITSTANPRVKDAATLQRRRVRRERQQHLVEGPHAVEAALMQGVVQELFATDSFSLEELGAGASLAKGLVTWVAPHVLAKLADTPAPQGVVAVANTPATARLDVLQSGVVIVADINDPGNAGTIVRTADASGAAGVVFTVGSVDPYSPKALRSAAGSTYHLPIVADVTPAELVAHARANDWHIAVFDAAGDVDVLAFTPTQAVTCLVFGHETHGLDPVLHEALDTAVTITMYGQAESLNVSAAAAIATYAVCGRYRTA